MINGLTIAIDFGYSNASHFAAAFRRPRGAKRSSVRRAGPGRVSSPEGVRQYRQHAIKYIGTARP